MNRFFNVIILFYSVEKRFYSVANFDEKPVGEQDKTHEFSQNGNCDQKKCYYSYTSKFK